MQGKNMQFQRFCSLRKFLKVCLFIIQYSECSNLCQGGGYHHGIRDGPRGAGFHEEVDDDGALPDVLGFHQELVVFPVEPLHLHRDFVQHRSCGVTWNFTAGISKLYWNFTAGISKLYWNFTARISLYWNLFESECKGALGFFSQNSTKAGVHSISVIFDVNH